jgi:hypothetical protein
MFTDGRQLPQTMRPEPIAVTSGMLDMSAADRIFGDQDRLRLRHRAAGAQWPGQAGR